MASLHRLSWPDDEKEAPDMSGLPLALVLGLLGWALIVVPIAMVLTR